MNNPAVAITAILCLTLLLLALPVLCAWLVYRGRTNASPLPSRVENLINPKPKPPEPAPPLSPLYPCPHCTKQAGYTLSPDRSRWLCQSCKGFIPISKRG